MVKNPPNQKPDDLETWYTKLGSRGPTEFIHMRNWVYLDVFMARSNMLFNKWENACLKKVDFIETIDSEVHELVVGTV